MDIERRRMFHLFKAAKEAGPYDELPMLPTDFDLQVHLSRNDRPQPFFLICDHDTQIVQMLGKGRVEFRESSVNSFDLEVGDFIFVPAGTPHRLIPDGEAVQLRYKAQHHELEGVVWYCEECGRELWREEWELADRSPQEGYVKACETFNGDPSLRRCQGCGAVHPAIDLSGFRWGEIAAGLRAEAAGAA